ncbi:uncharacterized protein C8Q71DRAFT_773062 [Rhodofomes roseus]|uniref:Uncharacterized protein n=1 Tax=Rhodofomes roseus TaxID=34475 RepID=A0ABQ8K830_9APHY|nr:uncharacterized protein C8Q71DRAFT_773062 [Rhodofomes roseus]KAH9833374.1 hypothetical protein C8Q71DRAFT_773062 [Rhodofomes roseus]
MFALRSKMIPGVIVGFNCTNFTMYASPFIYGWGSAKSGLQRNREGDVKQAPEPVSISSYITAHEKCSVCACLQHARCDVLPGSMSCSQCIDLGVQILCTVTQPSRARMWQRVKSEPAYYLSHHFMANLQLVLHAWEAQRARHAHAYEHFHHTVYPRLSNPLSPLYESDKTEYLEIYYSWRAVKTMTLMLYAYDGSYRRLLQRLREQRARQEARSRLCVWSY